MQKRIDFSKHQTKVIVLVALMGGLIAIMLLIFFQGKQVVAPSTDRTPETAEAVIPAKEPSLDTAEVVGGLNHPWEIAFLPDKTMLITERSGLLSSIKDGVKKPIMQIPNLFKVTESGLTGLAVDDDFDTNRYIYTCINAQMSSGLDVRLVRWKLNEDLSGLTDRKDIVTNMPANSNGYHSGCRIKSAKDGTIWIGTGDAYRGDAPQNPASLGGKILHVTRDGMPASGNLPAPFDPRIFNYGHRNVQGIILFDQPTKDGVYGYSIEHGSNIEDEINLLKSGNFGWAPPASYDQDGVPMTDLKKFPDAISAIWNSGSSTIAPSGGARLMGEKWGTWNSAVAMAVLKGKELRIVKFKSDNTIEFQKTALNNLGRIRTAVQGPDGNLYLSTDNGTNDKIIKVIPKQ